MTRLGTALRPAATRVMLLGSGELGKEVAIECQRLGVEVIAVDRYANAPAMHVAHRSYVIDSALRHCGKTDHEPGRHSSPGGRRITAPDLQLPFCRG